MSSIPRDVVAGSTAHTPVMLPVVCVACYAANNRALPQNCLMSPCPRHRSPLDVGALQQQVNATCAALTSARAPECLIVALRVAMQEIEDDSQRSAVFDALDAALTAAQRWIEDVGRVPPSLGDWSTAITAASAVVDYAQTLQAPPMLVAMMEESVRRLAASTDTSPDQYASAEHVFRWFVGLLGQWYGSEHPDPDDCRVAVADLAVTWSNPYLLLAVMRDLPSDCTEALDQSIKHLESAIRQRAVTDDDLRRHSAALDAVFAALRSH